MDLKEKKEKYLEKQKEYDEIFKKVFAFTNLQISNISSIVIEGNAVFDELLDNIIYLSNEILWLIRGGFSEGAYARFRLLHELIIRFEIMYWDKDGEILINRYILNNSLISLKNSNLTRKSKEYKKLEDEIKNEAIQDGLEKEFNDLLARKFIDRNWWFEIACNKNCENIGFSDFERKITEIKNRLTNENFKANNIVYKYTSNKVHGYDIDELKKFHRVFTVGKEIDEKLYLDDIINILYELNLELMSFIGFVFIGDKFTGKILKLGDDIIKEIKNIEKIHCK